MTMEENANLIEGLQKIGFSNTQILDFLLMIAGRIDMDEWKDRYESAFGNKSGDEK